MNKPKISVIVPIYNAIKYLGATVESLLSVTEPDIEIILVDDGSTDGSGELCNTVFDTRVRVIHKENGGVSSARNAGLAVATGDYIGFLDADDLIYPDTYSVLAEAAERTGADVAQCAVVCVEPDGRERTVYQPKIEIILERPFSPRELTHHLCYGCCSKIYKRELLEKIRFDEGFTIGEDLHFNLACLNLAKRMVISPKVGYRYMQREDSATHTANSGERLFAFRNMLKSAEKSFESPELQRYMLSCQLNNSTDVISKIILGGNGDYADTVSEIRSECRKNAGFILFRSALPKKQRLKLLAIGYLYGLYSRLLRKRKRGL